LAQARQQELYWFVPPTTIIGTIAIAVIVPSIAVVATTIVIDVGASQ
jgi:hypothetical protein